MSYNRTPLHNYTKRKLEELNLINDFLFQELLFQKEDGEKFARILLSTILDRQIRKVKVIPQKNIPGINTDKHGIRMDAYIEDISETPDTALIDARIVSDIYDIEPNNKYEKESLPKRTRYYHGLIDTQLLASGVDYNQLQNVIIIMILPYDPFDRNRMVYTIRNQCVEDNTISYIDDAEKIYLYTKGQFGNPSQKLKDMLKYIEHTTSDNIVNPDIESIHKLVEKVKKKKEVGINYMKSWEREKLIRDEGQSRINQLNIKLIESGRMDDIIKATQDHVYQEKLLKELEL